MCKAFRVMDSQQQEQMGVMLNPSVNNPIYYNLACCRSAVCNILQIFLGFHPMMCVTLHGETVASVGILRVCASNTSLLTVVDNRNPNNLANVPDT